MLAFATGKTARKECELCKQETLHREMEIHVQNRLFEFTWHPVPHGCSGIVKEKKEIKL